MTVVSDIISQRPASSSSDLADGLQLLELSSLSWERWHPLQHLNKDAPSPPGTEPGSEPTSKGQLAGSLDSPYVQSCGVISGS